VGETRPYISGTYFDAYNNGSRSQYQQTQIGITLDVTPLINPGGLVVMDIAQSVQQVGGSVTIDGNAVPITQDQNANAKVSVQNGETIVMGGFIQSQKSAAKSGIPLLKDIPLLGGLFRSTSTSGSRRELLVMIRPTVLPTPQAASQQTDAQRNSHPNLKEAEMEFKAEETKMLKHAESMTRKEEERLFNRDTPVTPAP
jgi:general secretion pathway protein D